MRVQIHELTQGSDAWLAFRQMHFGASEAAAMLGLSKKVKRNELLHMKKTGSAKEFSAWVQEHILDHGHEVEASARPHAEAHIGDDLYPVTCSAALLPESCGFQVSASCDGLTMCETTAWEHKQANAELFAAVERGELPDEYMPQCQQIMMVTGATRVVFTCSDGTPERMVHMEVLPDQTWFNRILAGWQQFAADLADYEHIEATPAAVAAPVKDLPALSIRVDGQLSLNHNLVLFGEKLESFIDGINTKPEDDQAFADAEAAIKVMERAETALGAAEASALGQISTVDDMVRTVATYKELARKTRLMLEKMVKARKEAIRVEIQQAAQAKATQHIADLNARLGKPYMPAVAVDFAGVMKGKKTVSSLRDAVDTELARFKIEANAVADKIRANLAVLRELAGAHMFLFSDAALIVLKQADDCAALIKLRIDEHTKAEAAKADALRAQIAEEERVKAEAAAQAQVAAETKHQLEEQAASIAAQRAAEAPAPVDVQAAEVPAVEQEPRRAVLAPEAHWPFPTAKRDPAPATAPPSLRLGQIGERLGFALPADFLRTLGFEPAGRDKSAILYHERDFPSICAALIRHIGAIQAKQAA